MQPCEYKNLVAISFLQHLIFIYETDPPRSSKDKMLLSSGNVVVKQLCVLKCGVKHETVPCVPENTHLEPRMLLINTVYFRNKAHFRCTMHGPVPKGSVPAWSLKEMEI